MYRIQHDFGQDGIGYFFFFQAEDGIRDADVTGVQTCALPILRSSFFSERRSAADGPRPKISSFRSAVAGIHGIFSSSCAKPDRSEERRVGKECRSRWSPYH